MAVSNEYAWQDITIKMMGKVITGARNITYKTSREHEDIKGLGGETVAVARKPKEREGSLTILQSEFEALMATLPKGSDPTDLAPFNIVVVYQVEGDPQIVTDVLEGCRINEHEKGMGVDDAFKEIEMPLSIAKIRYNV